MSMTNKLKKKVKRNCMILLVLTTILVAGLAILKQTNSSLFVMPNNNTGVSNLDETLEVEATIEDTAENEGTDTEDTIDTPNYPVINCDSIMQYVKDNDLTDGNYIFKVSRKNRRRSRNKRLPSRINKL